MNKNITITKRGSTPSTIQKQSPSINMSRKIVDANHPTQIKKIALNGASNYTRTSTNEEHMKQISKPSGSFIEKQYNQYIPQNGVFENFASKMQQQQVNPPYIQQSQNSPIFMTKQTSNQTNYQPFGVSDQEKQQTSNTIQYQPASYLKKQDLRKEDIMNTDIYRELLMKYENLADRFQEQKNDKIVLQDTVKEKEEQIKKLKQDNQKYLHESIVLKKRNQDLVKQNKGMKEQLQNHANEERKDNHEQLLEMMYAIKMHQQEEQMLQMAIQQSAEDIQNDPNFVNIDNMTYEEMLELEEKNGKVSRGLADEVIAQIPIVNFNSRYKHISDKCTICICEFEQGEKLKQLPCKHIYHPECVDSWLKQEKKCPVCKGEIASNCC